MRRSWFVVLVGMVGALALGGSIARSSGAASNDPAPLLTSSYSAEAKGDLAGALRHSRAASQLTPKAYFPLLRVAFLELTLKDFAGAARDYQKAAELEPKAIEPLLGLQQAHLALGKFAQAEAVGRDIVRRDPLNYLGRSRLAWSLYNLKRYGDSAKVYADLLNLYPGDIELAVGLGYAQLRGGKKRAAAQTFRQVLSMVPHQPRATAGLAASR